MKRQIKFFMKNRDGFTLTEVLAAIVIFSLIFIGLASLLLFTNKTAYSNNAKLVSVNLAKASMERVKIMPEAYFKLEDVGEDVRTYSVNNCKPTNCAELYQIQINDQTYHVELEVSQNIEEEKLNLINCVVTVKLVTDDRTIESTVEGYVHDENMEG